MSTPDQQDVTNAHYPHLFKPLTLAGRTLRNRIVLPATLTNFGKQNRITGNWQQFLVERARGGAGMIVSEVIAVDPNAVANPAVVTGYDDANADGFRQVAKAVDAAGAALVGQLWHPGRQQLWHPTKSPMGVSDQPDAYSWTVAHVMDETEIAAVADAYVNVAAMLQTYGFAGVELHGAHGYLIGQFLSPWSNTRDDAYGGDLERRAAFCRRIAENIRQVTGPAFIIGLKMPGTEQVSGGIDPDEAAKITRYLRSHRLFDYFAYGQGNFSLSLESHVPDLYFKPGHFLDIHKQMRAAADGVPVMALGRITGPDLAERVVAEGYGDLVGLCRAQIADPAFADKAKRGDTAAIRPSLFDNWCWGEVHKGKPLVEAHNPYLATAGEADDQPAAARVPKKLVVAGAGIAGLETAWRAAASGHEVTLFCAGAAPGGRFRRETLLPGRSDLREYLDYLQNLIDRYGVTVHLETEAGIPEIEAAAPDAVILATGATLRYPDSLITDDSIPAMSAIDYVDALQGQEQVGQGGTVLLYDHDHGPAVYGVADLLSERHDKVILVSPRPNLAENVNYCSAIGVYRRLYRNKVQLRVAERLHAVEKGEGWVQNIYTGETASVGPLHRIIYATPPKVRSDLAQALAELPTPIPCYAVGDCQSPRDKRAAVHGAAALVEMLNG